MIICTPNCPERKLHCHSTCKIYLINHTINVVQRRKQQREINMFAFFKDEKEAIVKKNEKNKRSKTHRKMYDC